MKKVITKCKENKLLSYEIFTAVGVERRLSSDGLTNG
jgi:hypothetical protein